LENLVAVFLGIIALGALAQAGVVVGIALGLKRAEAEVDAFAGSYEQKVGALVGKLEKLTAGLADASDGAVDQGRRVEIRLSAVVDRLGRRVEDASGHVADAFDETAEQIESHVVPGLVRKRGPLGQAREAWSAFREALAIFRA
jgi:hypothetical protein